MGTNIKKAGMFKKPKLKGILAFKKLPDTKNPAAPKSAIKKPMAAALPIALFIEYPKYHPLFSETYYLQFQQILS